VFHAYGVASFVLLAIGLAPFSCFPDEKSECMTISCFAAIFPLILASLARNIQNTPIFWLWKGFGPQKWKKFEENRLLLLLLAENRPKIAFGDSG